MQSLAAALISVALSTAASADLPTPDYSFISGDDLYDALSQDSFVLQGYTLGVTDALKHSANPAECFTIPLQPDADQVIYSSYLAYWSERSVRPDNAVEAITEMMRSQFSC
ncbi:MAG TPA: hypothetical protein VLA39_10615 [Marinobacterium sp.]|nr:hypothetical protein [Marinobacterium sp.]